MQARWYDPSTGQFLSVDPLDALTQQRYSYATDNPVDLIDPTGLGSQACTGDNQSLLFFTVGLDVCIVHTPGGNAITVTPSFTGGSGAGNYATSGGGTSSAETPGQYGGPFGIYGFGGAGPVGVYWQHFSSLGDCPVTGNNYGVAGGAGYSGGGGVSYTYVIVPMFTSPSILPSSLSSLWSSSLSSLLSSI